MRQLRRPGAVTHNAPRAPQREVFIRWHRWDQWEVYGTGFVPFVVSAPDEDAAYLEAFKRLEDR